MAVQRGAVSYNKDWSFAVLFPVTRAADRPLASAKSMWVLVSLYRWLEITGRADVRRVGLRGTLRCALAARDHRCSLVALVATSTGSNHL